MFEVRDACIAYGAAPAVSNVSLRIEPGELVVVVGPNGAGKSTLINAMSGVHRLASGQLVVDGEHISDLPAHRFCDRGIALVPEGRRLFTGLTVRENLEMGGYRAAARRGRLAAIERVCGLFPVLREKLDAPAALGAPPPDSPPFPGSPAPSTR
jgi:branched-chain amino acid transport system ATP-binding protein